MDNKKLQINESLTNYMITKLNEDSDSKERVTRETGDKIMRATDKVMTGGFWALGLGVLMGMSGFMFFGLAIAAAAGITAVVGHVINKVSNDKNDDGDAEKKLDNYIDKNIVAAKKSIENESGKDKEEHQKMLEQFNAIRYDEKGNKLSIKDSHQKLEATMGKEQLQQFRKDGEEFVKKSGMKKIQEADKELEKITPKELQQSRDDDKKTAPKANQQLKQLPPATQTTTPEKVQKDEDGNILKQEEVKDEKTGKMIKVITHTGPRGGKFYYPDGSPKDDEHKVYITK